MEVEIGRGKKARRAYGFDDVAIVPSRRTRDPDDVDISWTLGPYRFELPLLASAMDGVVSPRTAGIIGKLGGLAVLNLEGVQARYDDPDAVLQRIATADDTDLASLLADRGDADIRLEAAMAKMFATETAQQVIDEAVQICGGLGVMRGHPVEKLYREVRALRIYEGATEVQKLIIAKDLLK